MLQGVYFFALTTFINQMNLQKIITVLISGFLFKPKISKIAAAHSIITWSFQSKNISWVEEF